MRDNVPRNEPWDALVEATRANEVFEDGRIAFALKAILACCERDGIPIEDVPQLIHDRAQQYRVTFAGLTLTPTALARHWYRVVPEESTLDKWRKRFDDRGGSD